MSKAIKEVQQKIDGLKPTMKNIETFSKKEIKEAENWLNERANGTPTELRTTITVRDLYNWKKSGTIYSPRYQRGNVWPINLKKGLITTLANRGHIPDMVFAEKNGKYENIDGKQRINTLCELIDNKFPLPLSIPEYLGGGMLFKDAREDFKDYILSRPLGYTYLINPSDKLCQDTFLNLQQGIKLTVGEMIHGNYGYVAEFVDKMAQSHPINNFLDNKRFLNYRTFNALLMLESHYVTSLGTDTELSFVNQGQEKKMFDKDTENIFKETLTRMSYCVGGEHLRELSVLRSAVIYVWLRRNEKIGTTKNKGAKTNDFLNKYYRNSSEISSYVRVNPAKHNNILNEDASEYVTMLQQRSSKSQLKLLAKHLEKQYDLFNKNKMVEYSSKLGNMCE